MGDFLRGVTPDSAWESINSSRSSLNNMVFDLKGALESCYDRLESLIYWVFQPDYMPGSELPSVFRSNRAISS